VAELLEEAAAPSLSPRFGGDRAGRLRLRGPCVGVSSAITELEGPHGGQKSPPSREEREKNGAPLISTRLAMIGMIGMGVAPVPVLRLLLLVRLRVFVRIPVVLDEELAPGAILVVVPVVIILVVLIVDANLNVGVLRCGHGHDG